MTHDTTSGARRAHCPEDVLGWIPWYADGGLSERERGAVEAHAAECPECRAELDLVSGAPWSLDGVVLPDADRVFDEITARIAAEPQSDRATVIPIARGRTLSGEDMDRLERWVLDPDSEREERAEGGAPAAPARGRPLRPILAAAAALALFAIGGLAGALVEQRRSADAASATYQLASVDETPATATAAPALDVVFADAAPASAIRDRLRALGVEIISGPSQSGVYRLRITGAAVSGRAPGAADAAAIAARLVAPADGIAIFAEPVP